MARLVLLDADPRSQVPFGLEFLRLDEERAQSIIARRRATG
jgi:hypothetical protein